MPLVKNNTAVATPPAAPVAAEEPKPAKRTLKTKAAEPVEAAAEAVVEQVAKAAVAGLQPADMKPEQKRIQRSGIWQAVVQSHALVQYAPNHEAYLALVEKVADKGLEYVNRA